MTFLPACFPLFLGTEHPDYVPGRASQSACRRGHSRPGHNRRRGGQDRGHPRPGHSNLANHPEEQNEFCDNAATHASHHNSSARFETRGGRGRGRGRGGGGGRGGRGNSERWSQGPRWSRTECDHGPSVQDNGSNAGQQPSNTPPVYRSTDDSNQQQIPGEAYTGEFQHEPRETWPRMSRKGRDTRKPLTRHKEANQDDHAADTDYTASISPTELEHGHRKNRGWRGGGGGGGRQGYPRKKGPALHASSQGNWRDREPPNMNMEEEKLREDKARGNKEEPDWRGASGKDQWRRPQIQEQGQRRGGHPERRTGPVKRVEPPKSKETQTGEPTASILSTIVFAVNSFPKLFFLLLVWYIDDSLVQLHSLRPIHQPASSPGKQSLKTSRQSLFPIRQL